MIVDTSFDFTTDFPGYYDGFWERNGGIGCGAWDPDIVSPTLQRYHQVLWSKMLPCGRMMQLQSSRNPSYYLTWENFRFGSDTIIVDFRYHRYQYMHEKLRTLLPDYRAVVEDTVHKAYTIGGTIIFPKHQNSINQRKGTHSRIKDRWDLTMECIRRYYADEESPLSAVLENDKAFFDLFVDFKGYVDYFYLQDCVSDDYQSVDIWLGKGDFTENPLPQTVEAYQSWMTHEMAFLEKRNKRIAAAVNENRARSREP